MSNPTDNPETEDGRGTPRWVYYFGAALLLLALAFVALHLAGGGMGGHGP